MSKPSILAVDDDPLVVAAISPRPPRPATAPTTGCSGRRPARRRSTTLAELALRDDPVALIVADQRMPEMTGIEMLERARTHAPGAKNLLLTAYADTDVAIRAINDIDLDYYLLKPWDPPEERLYPVIDDLLDDWHRAHPDHTSEVRLVGHRWSDRSHEIKTFLARNYVPYRWYDVERDAEGERLRDLAAATPADLPARAGPGRRDPPVPHRPRGRPRPRAAHAAGPPALRRLHRRRRPGRPRRRGVRRLRGTAHRRGRARGARAVRPGRAPRSRTTSASPRG